MLAFLWAEDQNHLIGADGTLPWHLPADLAYFKAVTLNHTIVMGRKTYDSFPNGPLTQRHNIVLTRDKDRQFPAEVEVVGDKEQIMNLVAAHPDQTYFIIGGGSIFSLFMDEVELLYVTRIEKIFKGDVYMPKINYANFECISEKQGKMDKNNDVPFDFYVYKKV